MKGENKQQGQIGEKLAVNFLKKKGYSILETNFTAKIGEIDIIAKDKDIIVFIEVKARRTDKYGRPSESVTPYKQRKIIKTALLYHSINKLCDVQFRFDVIEVFIGQNDRINHIEDAFWID
ncbi:YraN family protein [Abyssisolibacter fermentans]|uniref:YraN family protein n=1 Tax=Abyssisolibacter fermentans TaxID=1766203 RepID=UPI00082FB16A|nr:YraN family protein [Abyssisolibacter fermentans]